MSVGTPAGFFREAIGANLRSAPQGVFSVCSAHPAVIRAAVRSAVSRRTPVVIESTCNQVNQDGGYTHLTPRQFAALVLGIAREHDLPADRLLLGGDHLGPNPWRHQPSEAAMDKAAALVRAYVQAGYRKIHLDASMKLADDSADEPLPKPIVASRTAFLAKQAEGAHRELPDSPPPLLFVIGTEVPVPGGATHSIDQLQVTTVADAVETLQSTSAAFRRAGLEAEWERVVGLVVQPGVEFGSEAVVAYRREAAEPLVRFIENQSAIVFEAHSTDYQSQRALSELVEDHFAILKVGPALTFAYREAMFALAHIESELLGSELAGRGSQLLSVLERAMLADPSDWQDYYQGTENRLRLARRYSLSDRIRYYWSKPEVAEAVARLKANLAAHPIPATLISQFLPNQHGKVQSGALSTGADDLIYGKIQDRLTDYHAACYGRSPSPGL
jgi:D-tagatose-1,6-bisphosphate aldolase subunit GatZ/KbaZ